jgi:hypothetical protein
MTPLPAPRCRQDPHRTGRLARRSRVFASCAGAKALPLAFGVYSSWSKEFLEAGKQWLVGGTQRQATSHEVVRLRSEVDQPKQWVAELSLNNRVL